MIQLIFNDQLSNYLSLLLLSELEPSWCIGEDNDNSDSSASEAVSTFFAFLLDRALPLCCFAVAKLWLALPLAIFLGDLDRLVFSLGGGL